MVRIECLVAEKGISQIIVVCVYMCMCICLCLCLAGIKAPSEPPKEPRNGSVPIDSNLPPTEDTGTIKGGGGGGKS